MALASIRRERRCALGLIAIEDQAGRIRTEIDVGSGQAEQLAVEDACDLVGALCQPDAWMSGSTVGNRRDGLSIAILHEFD